MPLHPSHLEAAHAANRAAEDTLAAARLRAAPIGSRAYGAGQQVASGAASAQTTAIAAAEVLIHASAACYVATGANPVAAATTGIPLNAGEKLLVRITSGDKVAAIQNAAAGVVNVVPVV